MCMCVYVCVPYPTFGKGKVAHVTLVIIMGDAHLCPSLDTGYGNIKIKAGL